MTHRLYQTKGSTNRKILEEFKFGLEKEINKTARSFALNNIKQEENAINALKTVCRKFTKEQVGKRPFTNINLVNI